jgi:CHAT domain-containing protein
VIRTLPIILLAAVACTSASHSDDSEFVGALSRLGVPRTIVPRLSITTVPITAVDTATMGRVNALLIRVSDRLRMSADPDALHAAALADLIWADSAGISLRRSISSLRSIVRWSNHPAPALGDLSAALLVRADRTGSTEDLLEAIDVAARSLALDTTGSAAQFDLALALDRLGLDEEAAKAWKHYLTMDATSQWANEARRASARLDLALAEARRDAPTLPDDALPVDIDRFATTYPEAARTFGWDSLLGSWGSALSAGDTARAGRVLQVATRLGAALERRPGDATLVDATRAIRAADPRRRRTLARAHCAYAAGRRAFLRGDYQHADTFFVAASRVRAWSPTLASWAVAYRSPTLMQSGDPTHALRLIEALQSRVDSTRYPALAAQVQWARALAIGRSGAGYAAAIEPLRVAGSLFERAGERENAGGAASTIADAEQVLGDLADANRSFAYALRMLRSDRHSFFLHNVLFIWADALAGGPLRTAMALQDEDVAVAAVTGSPVSITVAHTARAHLRVLAGDTVGARADVDTSLHDLDRVAPGPLHGWLSANIQLVRAAAAPGLRGQVTTLDSVVDFFHSIRNPALESQATVARAGAHLADRDTAGATHDLASVLTYLNTQDSATQGAALRVSLRDAARRWLDQLVMLRIGNPSEAIAVLERARVSVSRRWPGRIQTGPSTMLIDYALVEDTLLTWTVRGSRLALHRAFVDRESLLRTIARVNAALALRTYSSLTRDDLASLYECLIRPVEGDLAPGDSTLAIVADGELASIPFAALRGRHENRYLIERYTLRFANSVGDATADERPPQRAPHPHVLVVADPLFDPRAHPELDQLAGARAEATELRAIYPAATILEGGAATRSAVESDMPHATIVHFAGHAVVDNDEPDRSYLLLGGAANGSNGGLEAGTIARMNLRDARLVVLSSCETATTHTGRSGGFAGLTGAFLRGGARGVIGSLWRVDDQFTRPLMVALHRAYAASADGASALRSAQLELLRGTDVSLRSPAAWAAFRYTGL